MKKKNFDMDIFAQKQQKQMQKGSFQDGVYYGVYPSLILVIKTIETALIVIF